MSAAQVTPDTLNAAVEFDSPFRVNEDGTITTPLEGIYSPSVTFVEMEDRDPDRHPRGENEVDIDDIEWSAWGTYTQQYASAGSHIMHASEFLGGGMARDLLAEPGVYVVTTVEVDDDPESPAGWIVLKRGPYEMARYWVCSDCTQIMANGEFGTHEETEAHGAKMDAYAAEHPDEGDQVLGSLKLEHGTMPCGACGTTLHGYRHEAFSMVRRDRSIPKES